MALASVKKFGKRAVGHVDNAPPTVTVKQWVSKFNHNPGREVRPTFSVVHSSVFILFTGTEICGESFPHYRMDYAL